MVGMLLVAMLQVLFLLISPFGCLFEVQVKMVCLQIITEAFAHQELKR